MRRGCRGGACCRKIPSVPNANGIFGIIRSVKRIRALIGSRETWKISYVRVGKEGIRLWARFLRRLVQGFPGPLLKRGREQRPLSLPAKQARAKERKRMAIGASEKLAQEGLCGNLDRLAVGKRVGSCVRKIAHDLERMRGAGSLRRQYQTDRLVGMVRSL